MSGYVKDVSGKQNRLKSETSPYLLQHAHNPVDWYPWGQEAFDRALKEDRPVFLSIGYSTCHWCHVMERESFEDGEVARYLNEHFISIKVDREERPDIDHVYMTACQMMTGGGGWPLTIIMTPSKEPFFAATYIPKSSGFGHAGLLDILPEVMRMWENDRSLLTEQSTRVVSALKSASSRDPAAEPGIHLPDRAFASLEEDFDEKNGGFGRGTKFPMPHQLVFLFRYWRRTGSRQALHMVEKTLEAMRRGGIYDHAGYGFHRYSTDSQWLVPHFEKMLYDQAMLLFAYAEAYEATGKEQYAGTCREIARYVLRDMTDESGGFYSAEDADTDGEEGAFYLWSTAGVDRLFEKDEAGFVKKAFGITPEGNFVDPAEGRGTGMNILYRAVTGEDLARDFTIDKDEVSRRLESALGKMFDARSKRERPMKDDKIMTDFNGLMIAALAKAGRALDEPEYIQAARRAAAFVMQDLFRNGRLLHRYRKGEAGLDATLDDYAFFVWGLIELYQSTFETGYLQGALDLTDTMTAHFQDAESGGFYLSADDGEEVLVRPKDIYDGALPSGNSVAVINLLKLAGLTGRHEYESLARRAIMSAGNELEREPRNHAMLLNALDMLENPRVEVVISARPDTEDAAKMISELRSIYVPSMVILLRDPDRVEELAQIAPFVREQEMKDDKATAYVCVRQSCSQPVNDVDEMRKLILNNS